MRRERGRFNREKLNIKKVSYLISGILILSLIAFFAVSILYTGNINSKEKLAKFNSSVLDEYISDNNSIAEETSSGMGKTINEVEEENTIDNEISKKNEKPEEKENKSKDITNKVSSSENIVNETKKEIKDPDFKMPVEGEILKEYAQENLVYSTTLDEWITHNGIDIKAEKTEVVKASADGTIKSIKNDPRYGLTVVIEHVNGFTTVYSNLLTAEFIEEGEEVKQGQTIATVGNTATFEISDESHLHFEILKDNKYVDPELYIK